MDSKIDKHRQNPQDTCSKNPGRVFSEPAEGPQAITTSRTMLGDLTTGKQKHLLVGSVVFFKKMTFQNLKTETLKCAWEQFPHIQKSRYGGKIKNRKNPGFWPSLLSA